MNLTWTPRRLALAAVLVLAACGGGSSGGGTPPEGLAYGTNPASYPATEPIAPNRPSSTGGAVASYEVVPDLPAGLNLDPSTGIISGTPAAATPQATYTVTARNPAGAAQVALRLEITAPLAPPEALTYAENPAIYGLGISIPNAPTTGGGPVLSYAVTPDLPPGLALDPSTGAIVGTPTALAEPATFTVTATGARGSTTCALRLGVKEPGSVWLTPEASVVNTGSAQQFTARVAGSPAAELHWSASAGAIDDAGLLTAPRLPGEMTVTAASAAEPLRSASASVTVKPWTHPWVTVQVTAPAADGPITGDTLQVSATVWTFFFLSSVEADLDGVPFALAEVAGLCTGSVDLRPLAAGPHWLRVAATDFQGARTEVFRQLTLER